MKKVAPIILIIILKFAFCLAQDQPQSPVPLPTNILEDKSYDCVAINGDVAEMSATEDSLIITYTNPEKGQMEGGGGGRGGGVRTGIK